MRLRWHFRLAIPVLACSLRVVIRAGNDDSDAGAFAETAVLDAEIVSKVLLTISLYMF